MPIFQAGSLNTTALIVPDLYVQIIAPNLILLNGVPTNVLGMVGTASWGPVNRPAVFGTAAQYAATFGPVMNRKYDMGTAVALAVLQGAQQFRGVRVTDGTDAAASNQIKATDSTLQITVGGTAHTGDTATLNVTPNLGVLQALVYTLIGADTLNTAAIALAALVNANPACQAAGITADVPTAGVFKLHFNGTAPTVTGVITGGGATVTLTAAAAGSTTNVVQATANSIYTGSYGNNGILTITNGSAVGSWKAIVTMPGAIPETFDNLGAGLSGNYVWQAIASAVNNGVSGIRGPSQMLRMTAGIGSATPIAGAYQLAGGTDGATGVNTAAMVGVDTIPRTGMYALRNQGVSVAMLADVYDSASWSTQVAFGLFEGVYMILVGPPSDTIANATGPSGTKATAGIDSYAAKLLFGDWVYWFDPVNNLQRLVSPQGVMAGLLANLSPQNSSLNKQVYGIIGTEKSLTGQAYTAADLQALAGAGWDVIANPIPAGNQYGGRLGRNSSSSAAVHGDNYTRMTNYIASTLDRGMGQFVGKLQSRRPADKTRSNAKATLDAFMQALLDQGMIDDYLNVCDKSNNSDQRIGLGYLQADCQVVYLGVVEYFIVNLRGGQSVQIQRVGTQPATAGFFANVNPSLASATF
jgi:hypothetical protein